MPTHIDHPARQIDETLWRIMLPGEPLLAGCQQWHDDIGESGDWYGITTGMIGKTVPQCGEYFREPIGGDDWPESLDDWSVAECTHERGDLYSWNLLLIEPRGRHDRMVEIKARVEYDVYRDSDGTDINITDAWYVRVELLTCDGVTIEVCCRRDERSSDLWKSTHVAFETLDQVVFGIISERLDLSYWESASLVDSAKDVRG